MISYERGGGTMFFSAHFQCLRAYCPFSLRTKYTVVNFVNWNIECLNIPFKPEELFSQNQSQVTDNLLETSKLPKTFKKWFYGPLWSDLSKFDYTGKPVLTDTRDRRTLAHNGQILIERIFFFIKSLKYFSI